MSRDRALAVIAAVVTLAFAPTALANSGGLQSRLHNATFQGYGSPTQKAVVKSQVAARTHTKTAPRQTAAPLASTQSRGQLPFTGQDLALIVGVAAVLLAAGFALRLAGRRRTDDVS